MVQKHGVYCEHHGVAAATLKILAYSVCVHGLFSEHRECMVSTI